MNEPGVLACVEEDWVAALNLPQSLSQLLRARINFGRIPRMNRTFAALALAACAFGPIARAQISGSVSSATACPSTATLDQLIKAIDDAVSGPADKDRICFRDLFLPDAHLMPIAKQPDGSFAPRILTVDGWIDAVKKRGSAVFYERQVKVKSETYGHEAHLWSTYETRSTPDGKADVRGINSMQAVFDGQRWKLISILWQAETPADPVPEKYLP